MAALAACALWGLPSLAVAHTPVVAITDFDEDRLPLGCVDPQTRRKAFLTDLVPAAGNGGAAITPEQSEAVRQRRAENLRRVHAAGIPVAAGSSGGAPLTLCGPATARRLAFDS